MKAGRVRCVAGPHYGTKIIAGKQASPRITASFSSPRRIAMREVFGSVHS